MQAHNDIKYNEKVERAALLLAVMELDAKAFTNLNKKLIRINQHFLNTTHTDLLMQLFAHLLKFTASPLVLVFGKDCISCSLSAEQINNEAARRRFITENIVRITVKAFLETLQQYQCQFDYTDFSNILDVKIQEPSSTEMVEDLLYIVLTAYHHHHSEKLLGNNIRTILRKLILHDSSFQILLDNLDRNILKRIIATHNDITNLLHISFGSANHAEIPRKLLNLIDKLPENLLDKDGNNLLHACKHAENLELCKQYVADIDQPNAEGKTALHTAVLLNNLAKFSFLKSHGAKMTQAILDSFTEKSLQASYANSWLAKYLFAVRDGEDHVLSSTPPINKQYGFTCGFVAVHTATQHHRLLQHGIFKTESIPARKRDRNPRASTSLRQLAKAEGLTVIGEIFHCTHLQKIIAYTGCTSFTYEPKTYQQFISFIQLSLKGDCPVIIPYGHEGTDGSNAHWAVVIGTYPKTITKELMLVFAHHGKYEANHAAKIYHLFANIEQFSPKLYLFRDKGKDWNKSETKPVLTYSHNAELPGCDLHEDFRGKLISVLPPATDVEETRSKFTPQ